VQPAHQRGDALGDVVGVVDPLVLGVVLVAVVGPAAALELADLEAVPLDLVLDLGLADEGGHRDVGTHPVGDDDDVRYASGQLPQDGEQVRGRRPLRDLLPRRVHQWLVQDDGAVGRDDERPAPQRGDLPALVGLEQPAADRLDHVLRSPLLGELLGEGTDPQFHLGVGVLGGVRDVGAHGGVGPGGGEDRFQEGHVHGGGTTPRSLGAQGWRPATRAARLRRLPTGRDLTPGVGSAEQG
jgi:hypothetical protein